MATWQDQLRPASFRGVQFHVDDVSGEGGRDLVTHQFPQDPTGATAPAIRFPIQPTSFTEDLGLLSQTHKIRAYVLGDDYFVLRDGLLSACQNYNIPGKLVHPTLGERICFSGKLRWRESKDRGGFCEFDLEFIEAGPQLPRLVYDSSAALLAILAALLSALKYIAAIAVLIATNPHFLQNYLIAMAEGFAAGFVGSLVGLPASTVLAVAGAVRGILATPDTAAGAVACHSALIDALQTASDGLGSATSLPASRDPSYGLVALCGWSPASWPDAGVVPATGFLPASPTAFAALPVVQQRAVVAQMVQDSIRGAAVAAVANLYAQTTWPNAAAALAARGQLAHLLDQRLDAAANAGQDDLFQAWWALRAASMADMIARAQALPQLASYSVGAVLSADVLALRLYGDPTRADELVALNGVPHPLFMPMQGQRLVP